MRPSSSYDANAPYRAAIASLGNCNVFENEQAEQPDTANTTHQHSPFAELSPSRACSSNPCHAIADAGPSSVSDITISTVCQYLREKKHLFSPMSNGTILTRLDSVKLSPETLLAALKTAHDANDPLLANLSINNSERAELISRFIGILTRKQGFHKSMREVIQNSNNNPEQLIENLIHYMRSLNR